MSCEDQQRRFSAGEVVIENRDMPKTVVSRAVLFSFVVVSLPLLMLIDLLKGKYSLLHGCKITFSTFLAAITHSYNEISKRVKN